MAGIGQCLRLRQKFGCEGRFSTLAALVRPALKAIAVRGLSRSLKVEPLAQSNAATELRAAPRPLPSHYSFTTDNEPFGFRRLPIEENGLGIRKPEHVLSHYP